MSTEKGTLMSIKKTLAATTLLVATLAGVAGPATEAQAFVGGTAVTVTCPNTSMFTSTWSRTIIVQPYLMAAAAGETVYTWFRVTSLDTGIEFNSGWQASVLGPNQVLGASNLYNAAPGNYVLRVWHWSTSTGMVEAKVSYRINGGFATNWCIVP